ncbi:DUF4424 domain-containing protein [Corticibacterium sp. UT-5YL-CI-8]|nr:DUF4424 domain-containing protein [Tianweitania sp. UT-5YL-CI-8]
MSRTAVAAAMLLAACPAFANDTTAVFETGGLVFGRTFDIEMVKEDLFISQEKVTVDYVFRNSSDKDVTTIVAFPMPDIEASPYSDVGIPDTASDNFLDFSVEMDGKAIEPKLEQRAFAAGIDVTEDLKAHNVPLMPFGDASAAALKTLSADITDDWQRRGIVIPDGYNDDMDTMVPYWKLRSTYWWDAIFPAGKDVAVSHVYKPSVGGTAGTSFYYEGKFQPNFVGYQEKYCADDTFKRTIEQATKANKDGYTPYTETWISYILTTGGNWSLGTIGDFTLTIDKGDPKNLVSFCGKDVKKIGPTTFQMKAKDYYPEHDVDILIMKPVNFDASSQDNGK